jgi:hypothetical protein
MYRSSFAMIPAGRWHREIHGEPQLRALSLKQGAVS